MAHGDSGSKRQSATTTGNSCFSPSFSSSSPPLPACEPSSSIPLQQQQQQQRRVIHQPLSPQIDEQPPAGTPPNVRLKQESISAETQQQQQNNRHHSQSSLTSSATGRRFRSPFTSSDTAPTESPLKLYDSTTSTATITTMEDERQRGTLGTMNTDTNLSWTKRIQQHVKPSLASNGFIWESLDESMNDVQEAKRIRRKGANRFFIRYRETSYNTIRETFRLQNSERRESDIINFFGRIRLVLDYDLFVNKLMVFLNSRARIIFFIMMDLVVDALFCILYLVEVAKLREDLKNSGYGALPKPHWLFVPRLKPIWIITLAMSSWNIMSAIIRFIFADNKLRFIFSIQTLLDTITAVPFLIATAFLPNGQYLYVPYFLRSWSVISRLQRALSIGVEIGISDQPFDPVKAKLIGLIAYFVAILYNATCAFMYCEMMIAPGPSMEITILDAFYFTLITASTVGYGDITPKSQASKAVVMVLIIVALSILPGLIASTIDTIKSSRAGGGSYSRSWSRKGTKRQYLVLIGNFQNARRVNDMLNGFFNKEFANGDVRIVFLSRDKPGKDVKTLLDMPTYKSKTTMLVGNGLDETDLKRCQVKDAGGVFIIPEQISSGRETEDTMTTLLAWSIHLHAPQTPIYTHNLLPETESFQWGIVEKSVCIPDIKQLLMAYSCRHQGTATLLLNLLLPSEPANSYELGWQAQYGDSSGNEIYMTPVPEVFVGWTFAQVAWFVFQEFQSILIGVDICLSQDILNGTRGTNSKGVPYSLAMHRMSTHSSGFRYRWGRTSSEAACGDSTSHASTTSNHPPNSPKFGLKAGLNNLANMNNLSSTSLHSHSPSDGHQYHLTLNPGNSYCLGKRDQLAFIAQSPHDIEAIGQFTREQYERLARDERGFYQDADRDFTGAMKQYFELNSTRSQARSAARQRMTTKASNRAAKERARQEMLRVPSGSSIAEAEVDTQVSPSHSRQASASGTRTTEMFEPSHWSDHPLYQAEEPLDTVASIHQQYESSGQAHPSHVQSSANRFSEQSRNAGTQQHRKASCDSVHEKAAGKGHSIKARPAWNVALYGHGEDSDSADSSQSDDDGSSGQQRRAKTSSSSGMSAGTIQESDRPGITMRMMVDAADGAAETDRALFDTQGEKKHEMEPPLAFERNAAMVASMALVNDDSSMAWQNFNSLQAANAKRELLNQTELAAPRVVFDASIDQDQEKVQESSIPVVNTTLTPSPPGDDGKTTATTPSERPKKYLKIQESFQNLDPTTYIGQAAITRTEDKDLPLCHLLINPPKSIRSLIKEDLSRLKNHILICAPPGENLYRFIATLRLASIGKEDLKSIVVLTKNPLETYMYSTGKNAEGEDDETYAAAADDDEGEGHWDAILAFPRVNWVSGNCRHQRDLVRAGLLGAARVVVMSHAKEGQGNLDEFADSVAIMANHMIYQTLYQRGLLGRQNIIVDLKESINIRFLNMRADLTEFLVRKNVTRAAQDRWRSRSQPLLHHSRPTATRSNSDDLMPDELTIAMMAAGATPGPDSPHAPKQSSFSSSLSRHMISGSGSDASGSSGTSGLRSNQFIMSPIYASGQVLVSSLLDNVLFQAYTKKHIIDLLKLCCGVRFKQAIELDQLLGIDCSHLCLIDTPPQYVNKSFVKLFQELALVHGMVPLGLFRAPDRRLGNILPFVFTNPLPGILLKPGDKIYVLRP